MHTSCLVIGNLIDSELCLGPTCISNENIRMNHLDLRKRCIDKTFGKCYTCYCWLYLKKGIVQREKITFISRFNFVTVYKERLEYVERVLFKLPMKSTGSSFCMRLTCNLHHDLILNKDDLNSMRRAFPFYESYLPPIK